MKYEKERCELIECARAMEHYGLVMLSGGNVSLRMKDGTFLVTPSAMAYDSMIPEDIVLVNGKGETIEGKRRPTSDLEAILYIFEKMPDGSLILADRPCVIDVNPGCKFEEIRLLRCGPDTAERNGCISDIDG